MSPRATILPVFKERFWRIALCVCALTLSAGGCADPVAPPQSLPAPPVAAPVEEAKSSNAGRVPDYVWNTLEYVREHNKPPDGFVGGRTFENRERRLPQRTPDGKPVQYREWDVQPKVRGHSRGANRLVTGDDGSAWYTDDHYRTFTRIDTMLSERKASP